MTPYSTMKASHHGQDIKVSFSSEAYGPCFLSVLCFQQQGLTLCFVVQESAITIGCICFGSLLESHDHKSKEGFSCLVLGFLHSCQVVFGSLGCFSLLTDALSHSDFLNSLF